MYGIALRLDEHCNPSGIVRGIQITEWKRQLVEFKYHAI